MVTGRGLCRARRGGVAASSSSLTRQPTPSARCDSGGGGGLGRRGPQGELGERVYAGSWGPPLAKCRVVLKQKGAPKQQAVMDEEWCYTIATSAPAHAGDQTADATLRASFPPFPGDPTLPVPVHHGDVPRRVSQ